MELFPVESASKLGLTIIVDWLMQQVKGEATLPDAAALTRFDSVASVNAELRKVAELQRCLEFDDPLSFYEFEDVRASLARSGAVGTAIDALDLRAIASLLTLFGSVRSYFVKRSGLYPEMARLVEGVTVLTTPQEAILRCINDQGEVLDSASPELARIRRALVQTRARVRDAAMRALAHASAQGYAADDQPTIRAGRIVIPIRVEAKRKINGFVHDVSASGQTVFIEPESALQGNNEVRELESAEQREIVAIRTRLTDLIREQLPEIRAANTVLAKVDLLLAKAALGNRLGASVPTVSDEGVIRIPHGQNPALLLHFLQEGKGRHVVPFAVSLGEEVDLIVISGPNAGGKSVTMKAVGLMALMIAYGIPIPAGEGARFDLFKALFVDIGDEQSMADDLSTFTSHMKVLRRIIEHADPRSLALLDEIGTGTDPEVGGALGRAALEELLHKGVKTIVTTHFGQLKLFAHDEPRALNGSMIFDQKELRPTYEFVGGVPGSSYATEIATRVGLPAHVIQRANDLAATGHASAESLITDLTNKTNALEQERATAEALKRELMKQQETLTARLSQFQTEKDLIKDNALKQAEDIIQTANRTIEQAVRQIKESGASKEVTKQARGLVDSVKKDLDQARERSQKRKNAKTKKTVLSSTGKSPLSVGDKVKLSDSSTIGQVVEMGPKKVLIAFGSMQMKVDIARVVKVGGPSKQEVNIRQSASLGGNLSVHSVKVRLDIRGKRVDEAFSEIYPFLDKALGAGVQRVEILHGKGTGALRIALHEYLATAPGVIRFEEAPIEEGGAGVTHVYF